MHNFKYSGNTQYLQDSKIMNLLYSLDVQKKQHSLKLKKNIKNLKSLEYRVQLQSIESSNRIDGIYTSEKRLGELINQKKEPQNEVECSLLGYKDCFEVIKKVYTYFLPTSNNIKLLHKILYSKNRNGNAGLFKTNDNIITERDFSGIPIVRFIPVSASETELAMERMTESFLDTWKSNKENKLLLIPMFILDFLCIHPFSNGNGRISRLLSLLLLNNAGYNIEKYVSLEKLIEESKKEYFETLRISSEGWHDNSNTYKPFITYSLEVLLRAFDNLES